MNILHYIGIVGFLGLVSGVSIFLLEKFFGTWISEGIKNWMKSRFDKKCNKINSDRNLFIKIIDILPSNDSIALIQEYLIGIMPFNWDSLKQLDHFKEFSAQPINKFHKRKLAKLHNKLLESITNYLSLLANNTFKMDNNPRLSIVPKEWEFKDKDRYNEVKEKLNQMSTELINNYYTFVNKSKKKLQI